MNNSADNTQQEIKQPGNDDEFYSEESLNDISEIQKVNLLEEVNKVFNIDLQKPDGTTRKKDQKPVGSEEHDYYILILDPESQIYYRKIIERDDFIRIEPLEDQIRTKSGFSSEANSASQTPISNANGQIITAFEDDQTSLKKQI